MPDQEDVDDETPSRVLLAERAKLHSRLSQLKLLELQIKSEIPIEHARAIHTKSIQLGDSFTYIHDNLITLSATPKSGVQDFPTSDDVQRVNDVLITQLNISAHLNILEQRVRNSPIQQSRSVLRKIQLPTFSGQLSDWVSFRDVFISLVHDDQHISVIEKFHYLVGSVSGEALTLLRQFKLTEKNYLLAWNELKNRYDNDRKLGAYYLKQILNHKPASSQSLKSLVDFRKNVINNFSAIDALEFKNKSDFLYLTLCLEHLDPRTRQDFETEQNKLKVTHPTYKSLVDFVDGRCTALDMASLDLNSPTPLKAPSTNISSFPSTKRAYSLTTAAISTHKKSTTSPLNNNSSKTIESSSTLANSPPSDSSQELKTIYCPLCKGPHSLHRCTQFWNSKLDFKINFVNSRQRCINCLGANHSVSNCYSKERCRDCKGLHHSTLHEHFKAIPPSSSSVTTVTATTSSITSQTALLGTALVIIYDRNNIPVKLRALIDPGSQESILTESALRRLNLQIHSTQCQLIGAGSTPLPRVLGRTCCIVRSRFNHDKFVSINPLVMETILRETPTAMADPSYWSDVDQSNIADPLFWKPARVDILLGSDIFLDLLAPTVIHSKNKPKTLSTIFGLVIMGKPMPEILQSPPSPLVDNSNAQLSLTEMSNETSRLSSSSCLSTIVSNESLQDQHYDDNIHELMSQFWTIEEVSSCSNVHPEDRHCEQHFLNTYLRNKSGRFSVSLPFKLDPQMLGSSESIAMKRFLNLEAKLNRNHDLRFQYHEFILAYIELGHMSLTEQTSRYIIPHHGVFQQSGLVNKLRVVFDASAKTTSGFSLNCLLHSGPRLQSNIDDVLTNFRLHPIVFTADISKMFRQIEIHNSDRQYQHIYWRFKPEDPVKTYQLNTVTYGLTSSPYQSIRVLQQLVKEDGEQYPKASIALTNDIYVDDIATGALDVRSAIELYDEISSLLLRGGFTLHKILSNSEELMSTIPEDRRGADLSFSPNDVPITIKILGLHWKPSEDVFTYSVTTTPSQVTKRTVLSVIARIYDPIGYVAPIVLYAKILLQQLWSKGLDWDDVPDSNFVGTWTTFLNQLHLLSSISISRYLLHPAIVEHHLVGFSDASANAFAAVIYFVSVLSDGTCSPHLLKAKTKLAPMKTISIPRLELCGAHLLVKLYISLSKFTNCVSITSSRFYTDSTIVLGWMTMSPARLQVFTANRVSFILNHVSATQWYHVTSECNPADVASRGVLPSEISNHSLWWSGPPWLSLHPSEWPSSLPNSPDNLPELKSSHSNLLLSATDIPNPLHQACLRFSSYLRLVRTFAWMLRFRPSIYSPRQTGSLTAEEFQSALYKIIRIFQEVDFINEYNFATSTPISDRLKRLNIFTDEHGVLKVGGRLRHSHLPDAAKFPILLSQKSHLSVLIIEYLHQSNYHLGPQSLLARVSQTFHILGARTLIRSRIHKCLRCYRAKPQLLTPFMGDLPSSRVTIDRAFSTVGVDFAGPFLLRSSRLRSAKSTKSWMCVYVCFRTKAIHLELVSDLSSAAFLACFKRFCARRGLPKEIYSDCGTNFIGAARQLKEVYQWFNSTSNKSHILDQTSQLGIKWTFSPPSTPHFGGLWEAAVKSAKGHLLRTVGNTPLIYEDLTTLLCQVEAVLNSRPLCPISSSPENFEFLSPGHFLIGSALTSPPSQDISDTVSNRLDRWQLLTSILQRFWRRWSVEYLHTLQHRPKWYKPSRTVKEGDLVILRQQNTQPLSWPVARIRECHTGADGITRVVTLILPNGSTLRRSVHSLALLLSEDESMHQRIDHVGN